MFPLCLEVGRGVNRGLSLISPLTNPGKICFMCRFSSPSPLWLPSLHLPTPSRRKAWFFKGKILELSHFFKLIALSAAYGW